MLIAIGYVIIGLCVASLVIRLFKDGGGDDEGAYAVFGFVTFLWPLAVVAGFLAVPIIALGKWIRFLNS